MRYPAFALLFGLTIGSCLNAQNNRPLRTDTLFLKVMLHPISVSPGEQKNTFSALQLERAGMENGNLAIGYTLVRPEISNLRYELELAVRSDEGAYQAPLSASVRGDIGEVTPRRTAGAYEIVWLDVLERSRQFESIELRLVARQYGTLVFDCTAPPEFGFRQNLPLFAGVTLGVVTAGIGALLESRSRDDYEVYKQNASESNAEILYQDANNGHKTGIALLEAGGAVIAGTLVYHFVQKARFKRKKRAFDEYCRENKLSAVPEIGFPGQGAGLKLSFSF